jgi:hypothetical protein
MISMHLMAFFGLECKWEDTKLRIRAQRHLEIFGYSLFQKGVGVSDMYSHVTMLTINLWQGSVDMQLS